MEQSTIFTTIMIYDEIDFISNYKFLNKNFDVATRFIKETKLALLPAGKHVIESENVFALVSEYETKPTDEVDWEAHKKYIDIQIVLVGEEKIGFTRLNTLQITKEYDPEKDIMFLKGTGEYFTLKKGLFAVFFPHDAHRPGLNTTMQMHVKKLVIKILCE